MAHPAQQTVPQPVEIEQPLGRRELAQIFDRIVWDSQKDPAPYVNRWTIPGGAE